MKKKLFVLFSMCFLVLVGCGSSDNSNQTNAEQNNKFIGFRKTFINSRS